MRRVHEEKGLPEGTYGEFVMEKGICPLLEQDGLCGLQREKGAGVLPRVCKVFPRRGVARYSGYFERSLSPACEGVLALLWDHPEGVDFRSDPLPGDERKWATPLEDNYLSENFQDIRSLCIDFLQDRRWPLSHRILLMGLALQELAEGEANMPGWLKRGQLLLEQGDAGELLMGADNPRAANLAFLNNIRFMLLLMRTEQEIVPVVECMERWLSLRIDGNQIHANRKAYHSAQKRYRERFADRTYFMENLMVSLFFHLALPNITSLENLWKSYVNFCNIYAIYRFMSIMSCREDAPGDRDELFRLLVTITRTLIHSQTNQDRLRDEFFQNNSATLAHMAVLLCGT